MPEGFFPVARTVSAVLGGLYAAAMLPLTIPYIQTHLLFLHAVKIPWPSNYDSPEQYGLAPKKTMNLRITTDDGESLGAWFVLSDPFYHSLPAIPSQPAQHIPAALKTHPTILFFHGNAATRAFSARVQHYTAFSSRLSANVLAIDYRGFGDSTGTPTQAGLARDARAAWNWLIANGATAEQVLIVGHSLGTGVSALLSAELSDEGISPKGVVLLSPFSSILKVLETYKILGVLPLLRPLSMNPWADNLVKRAIIHPFETDTLVPRIKGPVLIAHAKNDWDIPYSHSQALFNTFLDPLLSLSPSPACSTEQERSALAAKRAEIVTTVELHKFGTVQAFTESGRSIVLVQTLAGGHDYLGVQEGLQDLIGRTFGLFGR